MAWDLLLLIGPNGASKTTTLAVVVGLLASTAGGARTLGLDPVGGGWIGPNYAATAKALVTASDVRMADTLRPGEFVSFVLEIDPSAG